jgi:hypothetical protein
MKKWELALKVFKPDSKGFSRYVSKEEMVKAFPQLEHKNGCDWGRKSGGLARKFKIEFVYDGKEVAGYRLVGLAEVDNARPIRKDIKERVVAAPCVVTGVSPSFSDTGRIECDHKNGRYDECRVGEPSEQEIEDFQPLHRAVNLIKRSHCKRCSSTGKRFDATNIGFSVGWTKGGPVRPNHELGCVGCYWHDPKDFHAKVSAGFRYGQRQS